MERKTRKLIGRPEVPRTGIGAILTKHRKAKGWTQAQLAKVIGIDLFAELVKEMQDTLGGDAS